MAFHLRRVSDSMGDSGPRSEALSWNEDRTLKEIVSHRPTIGCSMLVGSLTGRSYSRNDWWLTTPVLEILEEITNEDVDYVLFRTQNSDYEWWNGDYPKEKP